ncbi:PREDICTED: arylsulfatase B-like [Acropora digitifera]|uniref:arylsulfatase B-like n=1 Tax=Acropora digitifera TaxID=70779 RepID=UPI00077A5121|nr:PREDICTED: arylsulfatase B-like [Acropora digitifera]
MVPWLLPVFSLFYLLILNCGPIGVECKRPQPHILFMLADDLGWIDVGFHGSKIHTPNIDSLAKDGVILDNFYAQPVCTPARGALMTGRYPIHTGLQHTVIHPVDPFGLPLDFQTLPGQLREVGKRIIMGVFCFETIRPTDPTLKKHLHLFLHLRFTMKTFHHLCRLWDNTLTVFCSDNGGKPVYGGYNWPLRGTKQTLWEGGVRSTGFVHGKILERKGAKCDGLLHISDFFPTLINLAGGTFDPQNPIPVDGFDAWNTISRGDPSPRTEILLNIDPDSSLPGNFQGKALRMGSMKLLMNVPNTTWFKPPELGGVFPEKFLSNGSIAEEKDEQVLESLWENYLVNGERLEVALFNITADPNERHDLSQERPDVVKKMIERMKYYEDSTVPPLFKGADPNALKEARKNGIWGPWM